MNETDPQYEAICEHYNDLRREYEALMQVAVMYSEIIRRLMDEEV